MGHMAEAIMTKSFINPRQKKYFKEKEEVFTFSLSLFMFMVLFFIFLLTIRLCARMFLVCLYISRIC